MADDLPEQFDLVVIGTGIVNNWKHFLCIMTHSGRPFQASPSPALLPRPAELENPCSTSIAMSTTAMCGAPSVWIHIVPALTG